MEQQATMVAVRLRPPSAKESGVRCIREVDDKNVQFSNPDKSFSQYSYDKVFGEGKTQADVFDSSRHIVSSVLNGYNGTIMAYGQTGSGKTHTLIGSIDGEQRGLVPRAVQALGEGIEADTSGAQFEVRLSVVEIYCERIRDLLDPSRDNLQVKQDAAGAIFIEGAVEAQVCAEEQLVAIMHQGLAARTVAATCMNSTSSRSHCIVTVTVEKSCPDGSVLVGKLKLVDLAGSERQDKTMAAGQTLVEGSQINKSLSALANVIYALTDTGSSAGSAEAGSSAGEASGCSGGKHVPFRDSKLTRMLQDSLGGSSRTLLIICCSPCCENGPETLSSLRFGSRARGLKNTVSVHVRLNLEVLQKQLEKARAQIKELQQQLSTAQQHSGVAPQQQHSSTDSAQAASCSPDGPHTPPLVSRNASHSIGEPDRCSKTAGGSGTNGTRSLLSSGMDGSSSSSLLMQPLPWWQHAVIASLTAASVAAYVRWEHSVFWAGGC